MSVTREQMKSAATRLLRSQAEAFESFTVFELDDFDHYTEEEREQLIDLVFAADIAVTWKDSE